MTINSDPDVARKPYPLVRPLTGALLLIWASARFILKYRATESESRALGNVLGEGIVIAIVYCIAIMLTKKERRIGIGAAVAFVFAFFAIVSLFKTYNAS